MFDFETRRKEVLVELDDLKKDCEVLLKRIDEYKTELQNMNPITTEEEIRIFDEEHDLEKGLKHISLF